MRPRWTRHDGMALGGLLALPLVWYFTPLFTDACYYLGDLVAQYNPWWSYGQESLREGRFPLWNPYVFGGTPYHVNPENALFYPLKLPLLFLSFFKAAAILRALDTMVASAGTYLLLRSYGTRPISGVLGALMLSYGSFMAYEFVHIPYVNTAVWFPWQLLFLERLLRNRRPLDALLLATVTATSFLGGSPGIFLVCQLTLGFFLAAGLLRLILARRRAETLRFLGLLVLSVVLVVGLTLVLLAPTLQFIGSTPRAGGLQDPANFHRFSLVPEGVGTLVFPWTHQRYGAPYPPVYPIPFLYVPYLGVGAVLLALFNLRSRRYARLAPVTLAVLVFGVGAALGTHAGLLPWLIKRATPFGWFRWPHDYLLMAYLVLSIAAATGFDALWRARGARLRRFGPPAALYAGAALILAPWWSTLVMVLAGAGAVALARWLRPSRWPVSRREAARAVLGTAAVVALAADLFVHTYALRIYLPREALRLERAEAAVEWIRRRAPHDRVAFSSPGGGTYFAGQERVFGRYVPLTEEAFSGRRMHRRNRKLTDFDHWLRRVDAPEMDRWLAQRRSMFHDLDDTHWSHPVNASMLFGYPEVSGYDPFVSARVLRLFRALSIQRTWDLFGVRHVVTPHRLAYHGLEAAHRTGGLHIWRNPTALPRLTVPARVEGSLRPDAILRRLGGESFDAGRVALFEEPLPVELQAESPASAPAPGTAEILTYEPERVRVRADMLRPGIVVLHDVHHPGWEVVVDGVESRLLRANFVFRAVPLSAGVHEVEFVYRPRSFILSAWVSGSCWAACISALGFAAASRFRGRGRAG